MKKKLEFPSGFYWGAATSSYQVEGGIENCDWAEAAREGRVPFAGRAADHYNRYEEDFDIAKSLGHNSQRISIEWARIEPEEGKFDRKEIEHYRKVLLALRKRGLRPFVTIWHFSIPIWFSNKGGFENPRSPKIFARYCRYVVSELGDLCFNWATMNEPMVYASNGWISGHWPPFKTNIFRFVAVVYNLARAHIEGYKYIKEIAPMSEVSLVKNNMYFYTDWNPLNKIMLVVLRHVWNFWFLNLLMGHYDAIGLNYYLHKKFGFGTSYLKSDIGWELDPKGIYHVLLELKRFKKPVYVSESGLADREDVFRAQYIESLVYWMHRAIQDKVDLRGYMYWSLLDNFEWAHGFAQEFGLVEVDPATMKRSIRRSAFVYKRICENNGLLI